MKAKEYAWVYVVTHGYVNVVPSFYGGYDTIDKDGRSTRSYIEYKQLKSQADEAIKAIKLYGVNWSKTDDIHTETHSAFAGTFAESHDQDEYLQGWMTLNNGDRYFWIAENLSASDAFGYMEQSDKMKEDFAELFSR